MEAIYKTKPYEHQLECLQLSRDKQAFAIFLEQGLGKTKIVLDTAAYLYHKCRITGVVVVAPNGVHTNWVYREIPAHLIEDTNWLALDWQTQKAKTKKYKYAWEQLLEHDGLAIFCVNIEALSTVGDLSKAITEFMQARPSMLVVDESSRIKTPASRRTKRMHALAKHAVYKRILTGTPVTQSPFDLFSQFKFLDPRILGFSSYYSFKHQYGVWERKVATNESGRSWPYDELITYVRLNELSKSIQPYTYRKTKAECLDLPPKIYQREPVIMTTQQSKMYRAIAEEGELLIPDSGFELLAPLQIVRLLRCQQILGGFLPTITSQHIDAKNTPVVWQPIPGENPKLERLCELIDTSCQGKTIIWARFKAEIAIITAALKKQYGAGQVRELHGSVKPADKQCAVDDFQNLAGPRFLVGQQASGIGITLHAAEYVFYYSNTFSYEQRYQSEDRAHRIGLKHPVVYIDLEVAGTVDERIRDVLHNARANADLITHDSERIKHAE